MSNKIDWKTKYYSLRERVFEMVDAAYQMGMEHGFTSGQQAQNMPMAGNPNMPENASSGSEIDQYINEIESLLTKSEDFDDKNKLLKSLSSLKEKRDLEKISHKGFKWGYQNLNQPQKKALNSQHKVVEDILNKWDQEQKKTEAGIDSLLNKEIK